MTELLKDMFESWGERLRSPILGPIALSFLLINWQAIFFVLFANVPVFTRLNYFDANTSFMTFVWQPLALGLTLAFLSPWLKFAGAVVAKKPSKLLNQLQNDQARAHRIREYEKMAEEEDAKALYEAAAEQRKIEAAERLEEAKNVGDGTVGKEILQERNALENKRANSRDDDLAEISENDFSLLKRIASGASGRFEVKELRGKYSINIGSENFTLSNREEYLSTLESVSELRKNQLLETKHDAVSGFGYKYIRRIGGNETAAE